MRGPDRRSRGLRRPMTTPSPAPWREPVPRWSSSPATSPTARSRASRDMRSPSASIGGLPGRGPDPEPRRFAPPSTFPTCSASGVTRRPPTSSITCGYRCLRSTGACSLRSAPGVHHALAASGEGHPDRPHPDPAAGGDGRGRRPLRARHARLAEDFGVSPERIEVIPHGAFDYLTHQPDEVELPEELREVKGPVILTFGLVRPYKGTDVLLEAFARVRGAELWIVGMPRMPMKPLRELAARARAPSASSTGSSPTRRSPPSCAGPTSSRSPTGTSSSRASSIRRSPSAVPWCCLMSVASPRSRSWARPDWPRSGTPRRLPRCSKACSTIPPSASGRRRRLGGGPRHLLLGRDRPRDPRPLPTAAGPIIPCCGARDRLLGGRRPDRLRPPRLSAPPLGGWRGCSARRVGVRVAGGVAAGDADRACLRRAGGDRAAGRQRARARLPAGALAADRRLRRLLRPHRGAGPARPAPTGSWSCRGAARWRRWTPPSARPRARSSPSPTPTPSGAPIRSAGCSTALPTSEWATSAARSASLAERAETRRASTGATRWPCAGSSPASLG